MTIRSFVRTVLDPAIRRWLHGVERAEGPYVHLSRGVVPLPSPAPAYRRVPAAQRSAPSATGAVAAR